MIIDFNLFRRMLRLRREATPGPWYVSPEDHDDNDSPFVTLGPRPGQHYEDMIAQLHGGEHPHVANAEFIAFMASHAEDMCVQIEKMKSVMVGVEEAARKDDFEPLVKLLGELSREKGFKVIKPRSIDQSHPSGNKKLFLAGSIDMGKAEKWQQQVEDSISDFPVTVYNPRCDDWNPDLRQDISEPEFSYQVNWELDNIEASDVLFFYFSPGGPAPITLMELGKASPRGKSVIVCCPDGYWRKGNIQVLCKRNGLDLYDTLDEAINQLRYTLNR
jgi:hypothetical protein